MSKRHKNSHKDTNKIVENTYHPWIKTLIKLNFLSFYNGEVLESLELDVQKNLWNWVQ
jgi:hypothetical protein